MSNKRISIILDVDAEVSKAKGNIGSLSKIFDGIGGKQGNQLRSILADINTEYSKLADESGKAMTKIGDFSKAEKSLQKLDQLFGKLEKELGNIDKMSDSDLSKLFPPEVADRIKKASEAIKTYNTYVEESSKIKGAIGQATKQYEDQEKAVKKAAQALKELEDIQRGASKKQVVSADTKVLKANEVKAAVAELNQYEKELVEAQSKMDEFKKRKADLFTRGTQNKSSEFRQLNQELDAAEKNFNEATTKAAELKRELKNMVIQGDLDNEIKDAEKALEDAQAEAKELKKNLEDIRTEEMAKAFDQAKDKLKELANIDLDNLVQIDDIINLFKRFNEEGIEGVNKGITEMKQKMKDLENANKETGKAVEETERKQQDQNKAFSEIEGIKNRVLEFFSLNNAMQLAQRAMQQTIETVKQLDKAMTETAVVTDFTVGDMWKDLPRYTEAANELGATTLGAYETMTLFYQQGLETNEVFEIGTETMKMARIAGLDYAEATNLMTAALRGFNMELNETSAQRINDVYSELAAITAADTEEIATAMTKTASIAKSANMEFETTAAFLSQIIETTREPAETAGTAMKTIIARFTEMKEAATNIINVDGEEINVNKVEEALRSAGVALRDMNGEFRDTDDVFLELASKWDNLDIMTQRYIATMAAGSRQQSRFLAMMQDYERTIELVDAAYDSSGASQRQFEKTQESLESKINKLKNAWNEFLMGITNSNVIKKGVDLLTTLLNVVNKLTGNSGLAKLGVAIAAITGGKFLSNKLFGGAKESIISFLLKPLTEAGILSEDLAKKLASLGKGNWWSQMSNGWSKFTAGVTKAWGALAPMLPALLAIAAVVAGIAAAWYFSPKQMQTRKLKEAQDLSEGLANGLQDVKDAIQAIDDDKNSLQSLKDDLKDLVAGTDEWRLKLLEVQAEEAKLINKYRLSDDSGAVITDSNGVQTITAKGWQDIRDNQTEAQSRAEIATQVADAFVNKAEHELQVVSHTQDNFLKYAGSTIAKQFGMDSVGQEFLNDFFATNGELEAEGKIIDQKTKMAYKNAFKSAIVGSGEYSASEIDSIASINSSKIETYINQEIDKIGNKASTKDIKEWAENKGYIYENGKVYNITGQEVGTDDKETIANELAVFRATGRIQEENSNVLNYLRSGGSVVTGFGLNGVGVDDFAKIMGGDVSANYDLVKYLNNEENSAQIMSIATQVLKDQENKAAVISQLTGLTEQQILESLGAYSGNYEELFSDVLRYKIQETNNNQNLSKKEFYEEALLGGYDPSTLRDYAAELKQDPLNPATRSFNDRSGIVVQKENELTDFVESLDGATLQSVNNISKNLRTAFQSGGAAGKLFIESLLDMNTEQVSEVTSLIENIDFSNPIRGAAGLSEAMASIDDNIDADGKIRTFLEGLQEMSSTNYDLGSQFEYLFSSKIYDGLKDDISGLIEENGKLTADNIWELAGASEELSIMLEQDETVAESLAKAFTIVETQGLSAMNGLTTATLKALGTTETLSSMYSDMMSSIENFKPAIDTMSGIDFVGESLEKMKEMIDSGEYGNAQLHSYLQHFFGSKATQSVNSIDEYYQKLSRWSKNEGRNFWTEAMSLEALGTGDTVSTTFKTGNLGTISIEEGLTTKRAIEKLQSTMHITEDAARDYLAVLTSHSLDLTKTLKENDASAAVKTLVTERQKQLKVEKGGIVSEDEVKTIAVAYDMDEDTLKKWLEEDYEITIVGSFTDENGNPLTGDSLKEKFGSGEGQIELESVMILDTAPAESGFESVVDYVETKEVLMDLGMTEDQANETIDNFIQKNDGKVGIAVNGEIIPESTAQAANDWANSVISSVTLSTLTTFVDKLAKVDFTPVATSLLEALKKAKYEVSITGKVTTLLDTIGTWLYGLMTGGKKPSVDVNNKTTDSSGNTKTTTTTKVISPTFDINPTKSYVQRAKGSDGLPKDEEALTGEKGIELVQSKDGTAYLVGTNGPEIASLKKGDIVYPHDETKKILKGSPKKTFHGYASGTKSKVPTSLDMMALALKTVIASAKIIEAKKEKEKENKKNTPVLPVVADDRYAGNVQKVIEKNAKDRGTPTKNNENQTSQNKHITQNKNTSNNNNNNNNKNANQSTQQNGTTGKKTTSSAGRKTTGGNAKDTLANIDQKLEALDRKKKNGEISDTKWQSEKTSLLNQKHGLLETELNQILSKSKGAFFYDKTTDTVQQNKDKYNKLKDDEKQEIDKIYQEAVDINKAQNNIEDELVTLNKKGSTTADGKTTNTFNEKQKLSELEDKYENGELDAGEYGTQKRAILETQYQKELAAFENAYNNSDYKDYYTYDKKTGEFRLNEKEYNKTNPETQEKIDAEGDRLNGLYNTAKQTKEQYDNLAPAGYANSTKNNEAKAQAYDKRFEQGKMSTKEYTTKSSENLKDYRSNLKAQLNSTLNDSKNAGKYYQYDDILGTVLVNETKLAELGEEEQKKVLEEIAALEQVNGELEQVEQAIKDAKGEMYSTNNQQDTQSTLDKRYANGDIDGETYQNLKKQSNKSENTTAKAENAKILRDKEADIGQVYYDTETKTFKVNDLYNFEDDPEGTPNGKTATQKRADAQAEADKKTGELAGILDMDKGEERNKALKNFRQEWHDSEYSGLYYTDQFGHLKTDSIVYRKTNKTGQNEADTTVDTYNQNVEVQYDNKKEDKELTARENADQYDTKPFERALEDLERKYKNKEISFSEYRKGRDEQLLKQRKALMKEYDYQAKSNENKNLAKYVEFDYDTNGMAVGIKEVKDTYYELGKQQQQDVDDFMRIFDDISETVDSIDETVGDSEFKDPQDRADYNEADSALWNNQNEQYQLEEDREELAQLQGLVNKLPLPEELKTMTNMGFTAAEMGYEAQEVMNLRSEYENVDKLRGFREDRMDYIGTREEVADANSNAMYYYDENTRSYVIDEEKARKLDDEEYYKMMDEVKELDNEFASRLRQIAKELNGGIIQDATKTLGRTLTGLSKAFNSTGDTADNVKEALNEMENALGLSTTALDKFETDLTNAIKKSGLDKKTFKGLGILNEEQNEKMQSFFDDKIGGGVEGSSKIGDFLGMILGSGETNGLDFAQSFLGSMGEGFDFISGFMNFDMLNLGMDMFTQGIGLGQQIFDKIKSGIEKAKQMIEQVIQYIAQATQVLVDAWTNREDYLYNFLKVIEKHLQEYEELQRYSTQLEKGRLSTSQEILDNWNDQWKSLQLQLEEQTERLEQRQRELNMSRINPFALISGWDPTSDTLYENREVKMLWDIIIGLGEAFAPLGTGQFFSQLNQLYEDYDQRVQQSYEDRLAAEQALLDIEDERIELVKVGSDEATQFEEKLMDALIQKEQEAIDELSRLNDAVTEANQKLLSTLQNNLDKIRQDRENEKKEEELGEKERRLAYLRQDTSGANAMEIKKLEKELDEEHEDYTDTLIDQKISELEEQNELAAEQRQKQIDLLQGQLDYAEKYGLYWDKIYGMLYTIDENGKAVLNSDNFDLDGNIRENSELAKLLGTFSDRMGMSTWSQVLDNEEAKRLGRYYGAFIGMNGVDGNWANYWALLDPGANDPNYSYPEQEIPKGLWGVLYKLEIGIKKYFGNSDMGLVNTGGRIEQGFKNFFGKLFGYDEWANYEFTGFNPAHTNSTVFSGIKYTTDSIGAWFSKGFDNLTKGIKSAVDTNRTQSYRAVTENYNFNIGTVGESISLNEMIDKVTSAIKGLFTPNGVAYADKGH